MNRWRDQWRRLKLMAVRRAYGNTPKGLRVVLCRNGKVLTGIGPGAYHHAQTDRFAVLVGKPLEEQEAALYQFGFSRAHGDASIRASTSIAAYWHRQARYARATRRSH
jgi:hypothetical protein